MREHCDFLGLLRCGEGDEAPVGDVVVAVVAGDVDLTWEHCDFLGFLRC